MSARNPTRCFNCFCAISVTRHEQTMWQPFLRMYNRGGGFGPKFPPSDGVSGPTSTISDRRIVKGNSSYRSASVIEQFESELLTNFSNPLICGHHGQTSRVSSLCLSALGGK